jgi:hypothetical protein
VAAFIRQRQFNPDSVPPFSPGKLEFICRMPQLIEMVPGYGHRVCFFVMNAIDKNNKFVQEVLEGPHIFTDFFDQKLSNLRGVLSATSENGTAVIIMMPGSMGQRRKSPAPRSPRGRSRCGKANGGRHERLY